MRRKHEAGRSGQYVAIASAVAAAPGAVLAIMEIPLHSSYPLIEPYVEYGAPCLCGIAGASLIFRSLSRWRLSRAARHPIIAHLDQHEAQTSFPYYTDQVQRQFSILGLSISDFAKTLGITRFQARAILSDPETVPRTEYLQKIERALLLPKDFFSRGRGPHGEPAPYGRALTRRRLMWHKDRWQAAVHFFNALELDPDRADYRKLNRALSLIEREIEEKNGGKR